MSPARAGAGSSGDGKAASLGSAALPLASGGDDGLGGEARGGERPLRGSKRGSLSFPLTPSFPPSLPGALVRPGVRGERGSEPALRAENSFGRRDGFSYSRV